MSGDLVELTRGGRLASVLCRLSRSGFTGLVYAEHDEVSVAISIRDGRPVFVEDIANQQSIPDALLEQGLVTKEQYAAIATRVLEAQADNEDVEFCKVAVAMGVLKKAQVDAELQRRVRGGLIRAVEWEQCRIEIDDDPDSIAGILEYPQEVGALIYMGVRTFFDEERVRALIGPGEQHYARLLRPIAEILGFFELETDEAALLAHLQPDAPLAPIIEAKAIDTLEGWQLVCMLLLAEMIELQSTAFAPVVEPSGVRAARPPGAGADDGDAGAAPGQPRAVHGTPPRMPAVREEQVLRRSQARMPAVREEYVAPGSRPRIPVAREEVVAPGSRPRMPTAREPAARPVSRPQMPLAREDAAVPGSRPSAPTPPRGRVPSEDRSARSGASVARSAAAAGERAPSAAERAAAAHRQPSTPQQAVAAPAAASVERPRRRPVRKLSAALQRLDRELKQVRAQPSAPQPSALPAAAAAPEAGHGRAHVDQLMRMRATAMAQKQASAQGQAKAGEDFRLGQEALRDQQFGRAYEYLRKACESEPSNDVYSMFCMWAAFRSNNLPEEGIQKLRTVLRERVSDDDYKAFAYYALGHLSLAEKRDDLAEKFFKKAIDLDKHNKDAERHLRIIELRRKTAASEQRANKIFGIEIGINKKP